MKSCVRCGKIKPNESFRAGKTHRDGLASWCKACDVAYTREWAKKQHHIKAAQKELYHTRYSDPAMYGKQICLHLADYTLRAIQRFERRTGNEAPPQLTAILDLATKFADQQKPRTHRYDAKPCENCGETFQPRSSVSRWCSERCSRRDYDRRLRQRLRGNPEPLPTRYSDDPKVTAHNRHKAANRSPEYKARRLEKAKLKRAKARALATSDPHA